MLALNQQSPMDEKSQEFARARIGKAYDSGVAITEALGKEGTKSLGFDKEMGDVENNDRYNCVELIAQSYQNDEKIKHVAQPNEFLSLFTPSYMAQTGVKTS